MNDEAFIVHSTQNIVVGKSTHSTDLATDVAPVNASPEGREGDCSGRPGSERTGDGDREGAQAHEESGQATSTFWSWIDPSIPTSPQEVTPTKEDPPDAAETKEKESLEFSLWNSMVAWIDPQPNVPDFLGKTAKANGEISDENDDDDEDEASKLLGADLKSLPSVKTDFKASLKSRDFNAQLDDSATAVENTAKALDLPSDESTKTSGTAENNEAQSASPEAREETEVKAQDTTSKRSRRNGLKKTSSARSSASSKTGKNGTMDNRKNLLVKELREAVATHGRYDVRCANICSALGDLLLEMGQTEQAIKLHKDAVTIYSCKLGDDNTTTTNAKIRLGTVLENAGLYDEAINSYYIATSMRRSLLGDDDPSVADGFVLMAHTLRKKTDYQQAIKELKRALKIYREALGDANEKVSATVDEIASLYVTLGDFEKSAAILEEVVKLKAAILGPGNHAVAVTLSSLATAYECNAQCDKAMAALKKAYKIYTDLGGFSSEDATAVLNRMAQLYEATNDHNRAAIAYLGVLRGRKAVHSSEALIVGETYYKLGRALRKTGQLDKALKCMKEALPVYVNKASEVEDANMIAEIMREMALVNNDKNNHGDAARIFKQELGVRRKLGQPKFPMIARTLNHLGVAEYQNGNNTRALKYLVEALTIFQCQGEESLDCAEVLFNTGLVFESVNNAQRAREAFTEAARIFADQGYSDDHPHLAKAKHKIEKLQNSKKSRRKQMSSGRKGLFK